MSAARIILARVWRACQQKEEAACNGWLRSWTDEELDELIRVWEIRAAIAEGLLPDDAWTQAQGDEKRHGRVFSPMPSCLGVPWRLQR